MWYLAGIVLEDEQLRVESKIMKKKCELQFAVLGLGQFGMSIVKTLARYDVNVLVCDKDAARLHLAAEYATQAVQADAADIEAMEKVGLGNFDVVVIAMAEDFESTVMAAMAAKELGAGKVVAKAIGQMQKKILEKLGVNNVVLPEDEMGAKIARGLMEPNIMDVLESSGKYQITEMHPDKEWVGKTLGQADVRRKAGYNILAVLRDGDTIIPVKQDFVLREDDVVVALDENYMRK